MAMAVASYKATEVRTLVICKVNNNLGLYAKYGQLDEKHINV